jgi:hypothetical protein
VEWALAHSTEPVVVRVVTADDVAAVSRLDPGRIVSVEVPLRLAGAAWPEGVPLDVVLEDPSREAAGLYGLNPIARQRPVRVTIPGRPGAARASRIAMALQLPVRLLALQPSPAVLAELEEVLELYLHGAQTSAPVEFFHSALAWSLHGDAPPAWFALELDPDGFPRVGDDPAGAGQWPPAEAGFVQARLGHLVDGGAECAACRFRQWCQGFFKWPDPAYSCDGVTRLLARIEQSGAQLARDLDEARTLDP